MHVNLLSSIALLLSYAASDGAPVEVSGLQGLGDTRHHLVTSAATQHDYHVLVGLPQSYDETADRAARQLEASKAAEPSAPPLAMAASRDNLRRSVAEAALQDGETLEPPLEDAALRLQLKSQLKEKISELRAVAPELADQYQKLAPQ